MYTPEAVDRWGGPAGPEKNSWANMPDDVVGRGGSLPLPDSGAGGRTYPLPSTRAGIWAPRPSRTTTRPGPADRSGVRPALPAVSGKGRDYTPEQRKTLGHLDNRPMSAPGDLRGGGHGHRPGHVDQRGLLQRVFPPDYGPQSHWSWQVFCGGFLSGSSRPGASGTCSASPNWTPSAAPIGPSPLCPPPPAGIRAAAPAVLPAPRWKPRFTSPGVPPGCKWAAPFLSPMRPLPKPPLMDGRRRQYERPL